jgi:hypothetical protein
MIANQTFLTNDIKIEWVGSLGTLETSQINVVEVAIVVIELCMNCFFPYNIGFKVQTPLNSLHVRLFLFFFFFWVMSTLYAKS